MKVQRKLFPAFCLLPAGVQGMRGTNATSQCCMAAPDRNPGALVWKHRKAAGRMAVTVEEDFAETVRSSMRNLQSDARKIISFLQKPSLKYAA